MNEATETRIKSLSDQLKASFDIERIQFQEALDKAQSANIISSNFIQNLTTKQSVTTYAQISSDVNSGWSESNAPDPNPYPEPSYFYLNSTENETIDW
jgi:hypothetical protein